MTRRKRKTFKITELIKMVNRMNEESTCSPEIRIGWNCFVEGILMETKTYEGHNFATNSNRTEWDHTWINEGFLTQ